MTLRRDRGGGPNESPSSFTLTPSDPQGEWETPSPTRGARHPQSPWQWSPPAVTALKGPTEWEPDRHGVGSVLKRHFHRPITVAKGTSGPSPSHPHLHG